MNGDGPIKWNLHIGIGSPCSWNTIFSRSSFATIDPNCLSGKAIPIEERSADGSGILGAGQTRRVYPSANSPIQSEARNPALM